MLEIDLDRPITFGPPMLADPAEFICCYYLLSLRHPMSTVKGMNLYVFFFFLYATHKW